MATSIESSCSVFSIDSNGDFLGLNNHSGPYNILCTDYKTLRCYNVSDRQTILSYTLKGEAQYILPVTYNYQENQFVGIVKHSDKQKLCTWQPDQLEFADWKKRLVLQKILALVEVESNEPLVVKSDLTVCWLSQLEDNITRSLLPAHEKLTGGKTQVTWCKAYKNGDTDYLLYNLTHKETHYLCCLTYQSKQAKCEPMCISKAEVTSICQCPAQRDVVMGIDTDGTVWRMKIGQERETLHSLPSGQRVTGCYMLDADQLVIALNDNNKHTGLLVLFSLRFKVLNILQSLESDTCDADSLFIKSPYMLTVHKDKVYSHTYKFGKLTLLSMMGGAAATPETIPTGEDDSPTTQCITALSKMTKRNRGDVLGSVLGTYDRRTLLASLTSMCGEDAETWNSNSVLAILENTSTPSHTLVTVTKAAVRHKDTLVTDYLCYEQGDLPEQAISTLIDLALSETDEVMETDEIPQVPPTVSSRLDQLLCKEITDQYAIEAIKSLAFPRALMLLGYLCRCLESDDSTQLSREQVARWCSVLLDAHYIQLILSHQARLLLELHENTLQQIGLQQTVLRLGSQITTKLPTVIPSTGPYSIEAVTLHY